MSKDMNLPDNMQSRTDQSLPWNVEICKECGSEDFDNVESCATCWRVSTGDPHEEEEPDYD